MFHRVFSLSLAALVTVASSSSSQIMVRRGSLAAASNAPRMLVANPFTANQADSAAAVAIGNGLRERLSRHVGRDFSVVTREQMNAALAEWGYPADAILNQVTATTFAIKVPARTMVQSHLTRNPGGGLALSARLIGTNEAAGFLVSMSQPAGTKLEEFGAQVADLLRPGIRALGEARGCIEQAATKPDKAVEAAEKALKLIPNHGLAEFCLGALAAKEDSTSAEALRHYRNAIIGDAQSIEAYRQIGLIQQYTKDSTGVIETYQTMLRVDPTNQLLRDDAFGLFQRYGRPEAAEEVADEGIKLDPANTDWYDLKSNACLAQGKFDCAVRELEQVYAIDSTKTDTLFFKKIVFAAQQVPDTAAYLKWTRMGALRYPSDVDLLEGLSRAYALVGETDSTIAVTRRLVVLDETKTDAVLRVTQGLVNSGAAERSVEFVATIREFGSDQDKADFAGLMLQAAQPLISNAENRDTKRVMALSEAALATGTTEPARTEAANFFLGLAAYLEIAGIATDARASCQLARQEQVLIQKALPALRAAVAASNQQIATQAKQYLPVVEQESTAVTQVIGQICS